MATVSEVTSPTLSGLPYIDALIDTGPAWNYLTPAGNTIYYTFSVDSGTEAGRSGQSAFTSAQQQCTQYALEKYLTQITGVHFVLTTDGAAAQLHFSNIDITENSQTTGLCSWQSSYSYSSSNPTQVLTYTANAYVYLDNNEWYAQNQDLSPGGYGYETLLHELGHAMGLKHPFDGNITLPQEQDTTKYTLMSYTYDGGPHSVYSPYDIAALNWIYGGDGLRGALGINSTTGARYITGSDANDTLTGTGYDDTFEGNGGSDHIDGGDGTDTAVFHGAHTDFAITRLDNGALVVAGAAEKDGTDTLVNVEYLKFTDGTFASAQLANINASAPVAPTGSVTLAAGANNPAFAGAGQAGSTIALVNLGGTTIAKTTVAADGTWHIAPAAMPNGTYSASVVALDAAGNQSASASRVDFAISSDSNLSGDAGNNTLVSTAANNGIDGGAGIDTVVYDGAHDHFTVQKGVWGYSVVDNTGAQGSDTLVNVERIRFSDDRAVALDIGGNAGQVYRMYQAALDRAPDLGGFGFWLDQMDHGYTLDQITGLVLANKEAVDMYMSNPTDEYFLTQLYHHVLHREPDAEGLAWWMQNVQYSSRAHVMALFSESAENQAQVIGSIQNGIEYAPWHGG